MPLCHAAVDLSFTTDDDVKTKNARKMQHIFAYNGLLCGAITP